LREICLGGGRRSGDKKGGGNPELAWKGGFEKEWMGETKTKKGVALKGGIAPK